MTGEESYWAGLGPEDMEETPHSPDAIIRELRAELKRVQLDNRNMRQLIAMSCTDTSKAGSPVRYGQYDADGNYEPPLASLPNIPNLEDELQRTQNERDAAKRAAAEYMNWLSEKTRQCLNLDADIARHKSHADAAEGELHEMDNLRLENHDQAIEIARLREAHDKEYSSATRVLCADHAQSWYTARNEMNPKSGCVFCDMEAELDRLRKALKEIEQNGGSWSAKHASRALNPEQPK
jgi:chromosome segregation ATPase